MIKKGRKVGGRRVSALDSLKGTIDPLAKRIVLMAILTAELEKEGCSPVAAGDYAVELYTSGEYKAESVDMIVPGDAARSVLSRLDFENDGVRWVNTDIDMAVSIVGEDLEDAQLSRVNQIDVNGLSVYLLGLEDTVIEKLKGFSQRSDTTAVVWAQELLEAHVSEVDWAYLKDSAARNDVGAGLQGIIDELGIEEEEDEKYKAKF